jgi:hypothetical protein
MEALMESFRIWLSTTSLSEFMRTAQWAWPIAESIHFIGLTFLIGTVGLFDLRLLGLFGHIPLSALHRLIPWGILGYLVNVTTGIMFFTGYPDQYMYNPSFQLKVLFMLLAGINVIFFYTYTFQRLILSAPDKVPLAGRIAGGASLALWIGVITLGRMITFFRPPTYHSCPWC